MRWIFFRLFSLCLIILVCGAVLFCLYRGIKYFINSCYKILALFDDKRICMMTLALHLLLLIATKLLIYHYQDGLLIMTAVLLLLYFIFLLVIYRRRVIAKEVVLLYILCVAVQGLMTAGFGWIYPHPYITYLGDLNDFDFGSGLGILFYGAELVASCVLLVVIHIVKWIIQK